MNDTSRSLCYPVYVVIVFHLAKQSAKPLGFLLLFTVTLYMYAPEACNYLLVYEYVITADVEGDAWGGIKRAMETKGINRANSSRPQSRSGNRTLLLGGRKDGYICVFNWNSGDIEFEIEVGDSVIVCHQVGW